MAAEAAVLVERPEVELVDRSMRATAEHFRQMERQIAGRVLPGAVDVTGRPVTMQFGARQLVLLPLDTRRFVQAMARHISLN